MELYFLMLSLYIVILRLMVKKKLTKYTLNKASENLKKEYKLENLNWGNILDLSETEEIDGISASSIIKETSPSFVVAWGSTSLCESLNMGVIPIAF